MAFDVRAVTRHAHPEPAERDPYAFTLAEYALCAVAALVASPLIYAFMVVALTVLEQPR